MNLFFPYAFFFFFSFSINIIIIEAFLWILTWGQEMRLRFIVDAFTDPTCSSTTQVPAICFCGPWNRKSTSRDRTVSLASVPSSPMELSILASLEKNRNSARIPFWRSHFSIILCPKRKVTLLFKTKSDTFQTTFMMFSWLHQSDNSSSPDLFCFHLIYLSFYISSFWFFFFLWTTDKL